MIFLFEDFGYDSKFLEETIGYGKGPFPSQSESGFNTDCADGKVKIKGVGYCFYNGQPEGQPVFVLPKVFVYERDNKIQAFGKEINVEGKDIFGGKGEQKKEEKLTKDIRRKFLSSISLWLYAAIAKYNKLGDKVRGVRTPQQFETKKFEADPRYATLLDVASSMKLFYKKNQNLFVFVAKNKNCGNHKINWQQTINKKMPFFQDGSPIYMETVNKAKAFDLDDRLLVLYFSAMKYIQTIFSYDLPQSEFYKPLRINEMDRLLENERGLRELRRIKYKYFDDRLLKLYNIMEAFFRWGARYKNKNIQTKEYLIVNSFNNVFEAMIDDLISDQEPEVKRLKNNKDGKIIDHLYKEKSLVFASNTELDQIWHIGDSKYYKDIRDLDRKSIAKQYTYAKNIIQEFFEPNFFKYGNGVDSIKSVHDGIRYRDPITEGYGVTPNFFIRGDLPDFVDDSQYSSDFFTKKGQEVKIISEADSESVAGVDDDGVAIVRTQAQETIGEYLWRIRNRHFENRLFDRDTLLLQAYNINFLVVLKAYTSKQSTLRKKVQTEARDAFHKRFIKLLNDKYRFWALYLPNVQSDDYAARLKKFVDDNFRALVGRVFQPKGMSHCLILALEREVIRKSIEGEISPDKDDYKKIHDLVTAANCEVFYVFPQDIWGVEDLQRNPGWGET